MSLFWFDFLSDMVPNHLITANVDDFPAPLRDFRDQLEGRSMLVKRCRMEPVECVARGYVSGSGWKDYQRTGAICGIPLPAGLRESDAAARTHFHPRRQGRQRARREHLFRRQPSRLWDSKPLNCCAI